MDGQFIGPCLQEVATVTENDGFQMNFDFVAIGRKDRTEVEIGNRAGFDVERPDQLPRCDVERPSVQEVVMLGKIAPVHQPVILLAFSHERSIKDVQDARHPTSTVLLSVMPSNSFAAWRAASCSSVLRAFHGLTCSVSDS